MIQLNKKPKGEPMEISSTHIANQYAKIYSKKKIDLQNNKLNYDVHNMSPNELSNLIAKLVREKKINLSEAIHALLDRLDESQTKKGYKVQYFWEAWDDPNIKRDMLGIFYKILSKQAGESDERKS